MIFDTVNKLNQHTLRPVNDATEGSTQEAPIVFFKAKLDANSQHFTYFSRKHAGSTHVCFLRAS